MEIENTIKIMSESILKDNSSMNLLIQGALDKLNSVAQEIGDKRIISDNSIEAIRDVNRIMGSIHMCEWLLIKKIEVVEDLIRYI